MHNVLMAILLNQQNFIPNYQLFSEIKKGKVKNKRLEWVHINLVSLMHG